MKNQRKAFGVRRPARDNGKNVKLRLKADRNIFYSTTHTYPHTHTHRTKHTHTAKKTICSLPTLTLFGLTFCHCFVCFATRATFSIYFGSCIFQSTNGKLFLFSLSPTLCVSLSVIYLSLPRHYSRSLPSPDSQSESSLWCLGVRVMYDWDWQWNLAWDCI